ncbi:hypothetical protein [Edaphobacter dinghuensis]|uniref:Uncharacterized protein n=1 Tax=Edaphobacter dinghuensis TaxID=1560005 RepID=A0A917HR77_9BACT|nr:hypothetical protein [Edaphobacter dinghuensis]GGG87137.1 hypothetical protein GCM10011585_33960 [Edaphobacter dinghuensis]
MRNRYIVVGTEAYVHAFVRRLFLRRLCLAIAVTVMNVFAIAQILSQGISLVLNQVEFGIFTVLLSVLAGTLLNLWVYAVRTLALHQAVIEIPPTELIELREEKGEATCNSA